MVLTLNKKISRPVLCVLGIVLCCSGCYSVNRTETDMLNAYRWQSYVGDGVGIWVSIEQQELVLVDDYKIVKRYRCSTAAAGPGNKKDSGMTPLGWHKIGAKVGDGFEVGAVLKDREWTGQVWKEGQQMDKDLILSRILWLEGIEDGINRGGKVDTKDRYIYIHGTNAVNDLSKPTSAGCVRMDPIEVIDLYERVEVGIKVLITRD